MMELIDGMAMQIARYPFCKEMKYFMLKIEKIFSMQQNVGTRFLDQKIIFKNYSLKNNFHFLNSL